MKMNSFLKTVNSMTNKRSGLVRESLQKLLNSTVMEMQNAPGIEDNGTIGNCDESMSLCSVLEAIFLHGLKDSLLNRVTEVLSGPDFDAVPQPSFWGPLLVFSHRQIIDHIQGLAQLTTEVGYCRAWIRLALNEGLLASYLCSIRRDNSALKPYYNKSAFIRDSDFVEVAQRLIESLDRVNFQLACNTSLLNFWSTTPLLLAGIWSPPMKSCPVFSAVDIAKTITTVITDEENLDEVETASSIGSLSSFNSSQYGLNNITEDEALKIILANKKSNNTVEQRLMMNNARHTPPLKEETEQDVQRGEEGRDNDNSPKNIHTDTKIENNSVASNVCEGNIVEANGSSNEQVNNGSHDVATTVGNSLIGRVGWSTSFEDCESSLTASMISRDSDAPRTPADGPTYDAIIQSYHNGGNSSIPDLEEFLKKYPKKEEAIDETRTQVDSKVEINFDEQLGKLPREKGLDIQNYSCFDCGHAIGMTFSKAYVCSFSSYYYCSTCMSENEYLIPSRIIHNWELRHCPVSNKAAAYLENCPKLLDLKVLNPKIYSVVDTMAQLQCLRIQLNLLRAYLFTCREPIIESLQKKVAPRDYLYEHIHQYSVSDLFDIPSGALVQQLQKVVQFARNHVINCWLCSQKGFICEICNNPKVIYPFDVETTYRCGACNAVFHSDCLNASKPCPKCERRRKRMDLPLLDVGCT
ncbi:pleckstrin homology domain-containing family M member 1 [Ceratina calcarata]|uniref:Pleckstrin homology domain-containing family M member 1 n=1 Tax=Ceratina calcarata TaxID=156304 RepID=A0AAJ7NFC8_9HYME|nr:pleckstrin homology domain-containing family M member 1 [Ceratina calcarata]XP_017892450.1 pleckstrin homology domain-containing family M member 1 [Ceratina calcarata]XP_017892451.1 pleckstrin homology domain-containing family M member 1 [Ceratina calcarata]